jgi:hypothetical protein
MLRLNGHHLTTVIQLKVIEEHVLTEEWQTARQLFPIFERELKARTRVEPVRSHNFRVHLKKLVAEGRAEQLEPKLIGKKSGEAISNPAKLYRRKHE